MKQSEAELQKQLREMSVQSALHKEGLEKKLEIKQQMCKQALDRVV